MDNHDSIFAGLQACNPRDLCAALADWQHGESADFSLLLGVVRSLALTVDEQQHELAKLNAGLAAVGRVVERQRVPPELGGYPRSLAEWYVHEEPEQTEARPLPSHPTMRDALAELAEYVAGNTDKDGHLAGHKLAFVYRRLQALTGRAEREAIEPSPEGAAWLAQKNRLELVYAGLVDVWRMARPVVNDQREDIGNITRLHERTTALVAIEARLRAMLEAAGKLPPT